MEHSFAMEHRLTSVAALLLAPGAALHAADRPALTPPGPDPALAGDMVMQRLIKVTAPRQSAPTMRSSFVWMGARASWSMTTTCASRRGSRASTAGAAGVLCSVRTAPMSGR